MTKRRNGDAATGPRHQISDFGRLALAAGLSNVECADRLGVHVNTISRWSTGKADAPGPALAYMRLFLKMRDVLEIK